MRIGFIGLGAMGRPMVEHLIKAGHELHVWSRRNGKTAASADLATALGAMRHESRQALARACSIVCTNVFADADVESVALGEGGLIHGLPHSGLHIDFSTISPGCARRIAARYRERGIDFVDAPVSGGAAGAQAATLAIMWGGSAALEPTLEQIFGAIGKRWVRVGEAGAGQVAKACNQMVMVAAIEACAEAAQLAEAAGVDFAKVRQAMMGGSGASRVLEVFGGRMAERDFQAGVMSRLHQKDFGLLLGEAVKLGVPLPVASSVCQQLNAAQAMGQGERDTSCLLRVLELANSGFSTGKEAP